MRARLLRQAEPFVIHQRLDPRGEPVALGQIGQIGLRHLVLLFDPGGNLRIGADVVFQPAIGIGNPFAELHFGNLALGGLGIGQFQILGTYGYGRYGKQGTDQGAGAKGHGSLPKCKKREQA